MSFKNLGLGLGLRDQHIDHVIQNKTHLNWFEVISESYMKTDWTLRSESLKKLELVRRDYEVALHGVSLSLGSTDPLNESYLKCLRQLKDQVSPAIISDHLCWASVEGLYLHELMPLPYNEDTICHVVERILQVQEILGQRILIENLASYISYKHSEMTEWEFLSEITKRADCGILLDLNNVYISSVNHGFDPMDFVLNIPHSEVGQIHLAGYSEKEGYLLDSHDQPVSEDVWDLYLKSLKYLPSASTMLEWDAHVPDFETLQGEILRAKTIQERFFNPNEKAKSAPAPKVV